MPKNSHMGSEDGLNLNVSLWRVNSKMDNSQAGADGFTIQHMILDGLNKTNCTDLPI